jgi:hypothetical protein
LINSSKDRIWDDVSGQVFEFLVVGFATRFSPNDPAEPGAGRTT